MCALFVALAIVTLSIPASAQSPAPSTGPVDTARSAPTRARLSLVLAGWSLFGAANLPTVVGGFAGGVAQPSTLFLALPIVGPAALGIALMNQSSDVFCRPSGVCPQAFPIGPVLLLADAAVQVVGLGLAVAGHILQERQPARASVPTALSFAIVPTPRATGAAIVANWTAF